MLRLPGSVLRSHMADASRMNTSASAQLAGRLSTADSPEAFVYGKPACAPLEEGQVREI